MDRYECGTASLAPWPGDTEVAHEYDVTRRDTLRAVVQHALWTTLWTAPSPNATGCIQDTHHSSLTDERQSSQVGL